MRVLHCVLRAAVCLELVFGLMGVAHALPIVLVTSDASAGVSETADVATADLIRMGVRADDIARENASSFAHTAPSRTDVRVYLTLGVDALREVLKANVREPIVAALVPRSALERTVSDFGKRGFASLSALYLDQPLARQLDLVRLALPDAKRIGLVLGPESLLQQSALASAIRARGLEPVVGLTNTADGLFSGLKPSLDDADVLLAVPDSTVFNNSTLSSILTATYRARIPLIAFSPAYVKAGALVGVYSTPAQLGSQAAAMVRSHYAGGAAQASQYPTDFRVRINESVARSLGLTLREELLTEQLHRLERKP